MGAVIKTPVLYFLHFCVGGITYPPVAVAVSEQPRAGFISAEKRLSQSGCSAPMDTLFPPAHSGSQGKTRGIFTAQDIGRVDRVNRLGILRIVTFGTAQLNEPLAVAAAHHGRDADFA